MERILLKHSAQPWRFSRIEKIKTFLDDNEKEEKINILGQQE